MCAAEEKVILQPGFTPQYDDRAFREINKIPSSTTFPASKEQVTAMALVVRQHAQPVGSQGGNCLVEFLE